MTAMRFRWVPHGKGRKQADSNTIVAARWDDGSVRIEHVYEPYTTPSGQDFPDVSWVENAPYVREVRGMCRVTSLGWVPIARTDYVRVRLHISDIALPHNGPTFARTRTWVTSFRGYDEIWVDHSITWTRPMRDYRVLEVGFGAHIQWALGDNGGGIKWHDRPWWNGEQPLGEPLSQAELVRTTSAIPVDEFKENKKEHYLFADMHGTSIRDRWVFPNEKGSAPQPMPLPLGPTAAELESSGVLGDISCGSRDAVDNYIATMARAFHDRATPGRFTEGNPPRKWVAKEDRPSAHRPGIGSYYCWGETLWLEAARLDNGSLYTCAQAMTDHMVQMGQCAADGHEFIMAPVEPWVEGLPRFIQVRVPMAGLPEWHRPGVFWKNGEPVGSPEGMPITDDWSSHFGRTPDPQGLLYAYLIGGDHRAKWGFDLWRDNANFASFTGGRNRESAKTIGMVADVCEWFPELRPTWKPYLEKLVKTQIGSPGIDQVPNSLWDPLWMHKAFPHLPELLGTELYVWARRWSDALDAKGLTRNQDTETLALTAFAAGYAPNVTKHLPWIAHQVHRAAGVGPGALGDAFLARQWGTYRRQLERQNIPVNLTRKWKPLIPAASISFGFTAGVAKSGTRFTVSTDTTTLAFPIRTYPVSGDPDPMAIVIQDEAGNTLHTSEWRYQGSTRENDVSYTRTFAFQVPRPGRYHIRVGGHEAQILVWPGVESVLMPAGNYLVGAPMRLAFRRSPGDMQGPMAPITVRGQSPETWVEVEGGARLRWMETTAFDPNGDALSIIGGHVPEARLTLVEPLEVVWTE